MRLPLAIGLALAACGASPVASDGGVVGDGAALDLASFDGANTLDGGADGAAPDLARKLDGGEGTSKGSVTLTYYYVASESDYTGANDTILCDDALATIATVPLAFANALQIEGTGKLNDGRTVNASSNCACPSGMTTCYAVLNPAMYPWGIGVGSRPLKPFRSIAVDPSFIAYGTKVYVPELDGVQMPATYGFLHDGCLEADDTGGAIVGAHIDFFAAEKKNYLTLDAMLGLSSVTAYINPPRCP